MFDVHPQAPRKAESLAGLQRPLPQSGLGLGGVNTPREIVDDSNSERTADRIAAAVVDGITMTESQSTGAASSGSAAPGMVSDAGCGVDGHPLDPSTRALMESALGHNFSQVRVHTDARAADAAGALDALAYAEGEDIVFGADQYAPDTTEGISLIAHELAHVVEQWGSPGARGEARRIQRKPATVTKSAKKTVTPEAAIQDYVEALGYLDAYFTVAVEILNDVYSNTHVAIESFGKYATSSKGETVEPPVALIKAVLGLIPGAAPILETLELLEKGVAISKDVSKVVSSEKEEQGKSVPVEEAQQQSKAVTSFTEKKSLLLAQREKATKDLKAMQTSGGNAGGLEQLVKQSLGAIPKYDSLVIDKFRLEFELQLYKKHCLANAWINHMPPSFLGTPYTSYRIKEVPRTEQKRILELQTSLGHVAKVAIDERYAEHEGTPEDAKVVEILLDWGVQLYWLRGYASNEPEKLHTGADLQSPYKGERFKELK